MRWRNALLPLLLLCIGFPALAQQDSSAYSRIYSLPDKLFNGLNKKTQDFERKLDKQTDRYLSRLAKQEKKMRRKLWKKDSLAAKNLFGDVDKRYASLKSSAGNLTNAYSAHLDSMHTGLRFLDGRNITPAGNEKFTRTLGSYSKLQDKFNQTDEIKKHLKDRQHQLKQQLEKFGLAKEFKKFQKDVYYYRAQVDEYKKLFEDPSKAEEKLLQLANTIPAFRKFFSEQSMLAGLFPSSEGVGNMVSNAVDLQGLQTRNSVQQLIQQRIASGGAGSRQALQQNIQQAQSQLAQWKDKIIKSGGGGSDADMPDFKPNSQKTKSFFKRLEFGTNLQSAKSNYFFPTTTDLGLSVGYKLNDRSIAGVGASYKIGWGKDISHISISHEGVGLRSFLDWKIKGSFYASGGFEYNYQKPFSSMQQLRAYDDWRRSGLVGISKVISVNSKVFKKTKVQLLWDFLSYEQVPRAQPIKFRLGYNF
jgi:CII-binding regulator of phage lambda lysogenization HflD